MTPTPAVSARKARGWRYSINYGPEGEANYAMVYDADDVLVSNLKTYHAVAVVTAMNAALFDGEDAERAREAQSQSLWRQALDAERVPLSTEGEAEPGREDEIASLFCRIRDCWDEDLCPTWGLVEPLIDKLSRAALAASPAAPAAAAGVESFGIPFEQFWGEISDQERERIRKTDLYKRGDTVAVWVNEGDLYMARAASPAPDAKER